MIVIHIKSGKRFWTDGSKDLHTHLGYIKKENLEPGRIVESHKGELFVVFEDSFSDLLRFLKRGPQAAHSKDIGAILSITGISSGWKVLEAGSGSGILTSYLANAVKPDGKVYSYEIREEFLQIAKKNVEKLGLSDYVEFKLKDVTESVDERELDAIILDIGDPWNAIDNAWGALKVGGWLVVLLPNITSVDKLLRSCKNRFLIEKILEVNSREWMWKENGVLRPKSTQIVHTEFLIFLRKLPPFP